MDSITNSKIVTSSSYSPDLPSSSNYSCTNLPILSNYSQDLKCMSSYTTDLPSLPRYSMNLVPPPSLPYPSSTDLPSPHNHSLAQANHVEYLPHQNTCTDLTSSPGQSGGCSFSFSPGLKPQQNYGGDCFKTIYSYSLFGPGLCDGSLHVHTASPSHTSFSSDHSVQVNFSSSSSDVLDDGWCWGEDSSQLSWGEEGQLMDKVGWEQGEL